MEKIPVNGFFFLFFCNFKEFLNFKVIIMMYQTDNYCLVSTKGNLPYYEDKKNRFSLRHFPEHSQLNKVRNKALPRIKIHGIYVTEVVIVLCHVSCYTIFAKKEHHLCL